MAHQVTGWRIDMLASTASRTMSRASKTLATMPTGSNYSSTTTMYT
jgi:hypothetical protein